MGNHTSTGCFKTSIDNKIQLNKSKSLSNAEPNLKQWTAR